MVAIPNVIIANVEQTIRNHILEWANAYNSRDVAKLVSLYSSEGYYMAPYQSMGEGRDSIRKGFEERFAEFDPHDLILKTIHVSIEGNSAFCIGAYHVDFQAPNGTRLDDHGKWLSTFRKEGTEWRMVAHCWNSDLTPVMYGQ